MTAGFDVVVIGAGIVGAAVARECTRAGLRTAVVEPEQPLAGATSKGMGHVVALDDALALLALTRYSRSLWLREAARLPEYRSAGTLWIAADADELATAEARCAAYRDAGVDAEILAPAALYASEPNLREGLAGALLVPEDGICDPPAAAAFYLDEAIRAGTRLFRARALAAQQGRVELADRTCLQARAIVLAAGTDCSLLPALPLRKRKGTLLLTEPCPGFVSHQLVELGYGKSAHAAGDAVAFNVQPRPNGQLCIGASRQWSDTPEADPHILAELRSRALSFLPALASIPVATTRTGFRPATPDGLPILGRATGLSPDATLWLCAGFEGYGITSAPGAAKLIVDSMLERPPAIDPTPYLATRFHQGATA